jgi:hypothetical protein
MLNDLLEDTITVQKQNGQVFNNVKARVLPQLVLVLDTSIPVEAGDKITRTLPNKLTETYEVLSSSFISKVLDIPAHYQLEGKSQHLQVS